MRLNSHGALRFAATLWLAFSGGRAVADEPVWLDVTSPDANEHITEIVPLLEVRGRAVVGPATPYDLVVAIDLSASTLLPSGSDIDGDGMVGTMRRRALRRTSSQSHRRWTTDPGDTIARAELLGAQRLLRRVDERWTRVAILTFAGQARLRARLGHPEDALFALERVKVRHERSGTNLASAIRMGLRVLRKSPPDRERILVILSDGYPTAPRPEIYASRAALRMGKRAAEAGVRIYAFAIGPGALERPDVLRQLASSTDGRYFEVREPGEIIDHLPRLDVALLEDVSLINHTTGARGRAVRVFADGSFDGYVHLKPGENNLTVEARAPDGREFRVERTVHYKPPEGISLSALKRASELRESLRVRTAETELAAQAHGKLTLKRSIEIQVDPTRVLR